MCDSSFDKLNRVSFFQIMSAATRSRKTQSPAAQEAAQEGAKSKVTVAGIVKAFKANPVEVAAVLYLANAKLVKDGLHTGLANLSLALTNANKVSAEKAMPGSIVTSKLSKLPAYSLSPVGKEVVGHRLFSKIFADAQAEVKDKVVETVADAKQAVHDASPYLSGRRCASKTAECAYCSNPTKFIYQNRRVCHRKGCVEQGERASPLAEEDARLGDLVAPRNAKQIYLDNRSSHSRPQPCQFGCTNKEGEPNKTKFSYNGSWCCHRKGCFEQAVLQGRNVEEEEEEEEEAPVAPPTVPLKEANVDIAENQAEVQTIMENANAMDEDDDIAEQVEDFLDRSKRSRE